MRICICATQVPFHTGGAEIHVEGLRRELEARGFDVSVVTLPFDHSTRLEIIKSSLAWRLVNLQAGGATGGPDLVIATRFPSYAVKHPNKVVWLIHQYRQVYDLLGTPYSDFKDDPQDRQVVEMVRSIDRRALGEARALFTNSRNTADRLKRFNDLVARPLYPPPGLDGAYRCDKYGDFLFSVGRLDTLKRFDLLIRALQHTSAEVRCLIAGECPERRKLPALFEVLGLAERVQLLGRISDEELLVRYAEAFAVFYAPYDEDYGYVTIEAFRSRKAVITARDSGGVLEFVRDGINGYVCSSADPRQFARPIEQLHADRELAKRLGERGAEAVSEIAWDHVISSLTGRLTARG